MTNGRIIDRAIRGRARRVALAAALALAGAATSASSAAAIPWDAPGAIPPEQTPSPTLPDPDCLQSYADDAPAGGPRLRFGVGPRLAGEAGTSQVTQSVPENKRLRDEALLRLQGKRHLSVRLNRLFQADGAPGIREFKRMAKHYSSLGIDVTLQVRYHPAPEQDGDIGAWLDYVRKVVRAFGPIEHVTALQITNEADLTLSPNTSDGAYAGAVEALARGVPAAAREAKRRGYEQLTVGFNFAYGNGIFGDDAAFWRAVGAAGGERLRKATDWVGIDSYPGTFVPSAFADPADALLEQVAQMRECLMPLAGFGARMPIHVDELGYPTGPGRTEQEQTRALKGFMGALSRYRGTYGIEEAIWFGLRDNNSAGPNFQSFFGLLHDDYSPKPAFGAYRKLIRKRGA
ncbi:MAG: hypothetical protein KDB58_04130 [Solirubrobacterales bacterium]|nr:hypothetical protein [Solirubrobacterales bacterium]MCB8971018.1 hypothetical protein [Thermoleophilales bacterium]